MKTKTIIEDYYENIDLHTNVQQKGILGLLREKLIKFNEDRDKTAFNMLPPRVETFLDIGCNDGNFLIYTHEKYKHGFGVDISRNIIKTAQKNVYSHGLSSKILIKRADIEMGLPFRHEQMDLVTCLAVIEHLFDPQKAFIEIGRVLKKGGYLIVEVPNLAWLPRRLALLFGVRPRTSWDAGLDGGHISYFTFDSLQKLLEDSGFKVLKIGCSGVFAKLRYIYPSLLSGNIIFLAKKNKDKSKKRKA